MSSRTMMVKARSHHIRRSILLPPPGSFGAPVSATTEEVATSAATSAVPTTVLYLGHPSFQIAVQTSSHPKTQKPTPPTIKAPSRAHDRKAHAPLNEKGPAAQQPNGVGQRLRMRCYVCVLLVGGVTELHGAQRAGPRFDEPWPAPAKAQRLSIG